MRNPFLIFILLSILGFSSCKKELTDEDIQSNIKMYYMQMGIAAGSGSWKPNAVRILKKEIDKRHKGAWLITTEIKGIYESPPLGNPVADELFCDTLMFSLEQNEHHNWECSPVEYDPVILLKYFK